MFENKQTNKHTIKTSTQNKPQTTTQQHTKTKQTKEHTTPKHKQIKHIEEPNQAHKTNTNQNK